MPTLQAVYASPGELGVGRVSARVGRLDPYVTRVASTWDLHAPDSHWRSLDGSLVFVDISGFTSLSERLARRGRIGAEELTAVLNRVFGHMLDIVFQRGGSLLKFGGDALLLLFDTADHVMQACAATVEMRAALREASKEKTSVGRINLKMSSGIHTGSIDFFLVGSSHRELLVTGPTASITTQMEATADAGEIVVSEAIRDALPVDFVGNAKGSGWLLRKQRISHPQCGPVWRETDQEEDLGTYVPRSLRAYLESGIGDSEHRIATIGFLKFKGVDALLEAEGPEGVAQRLDALVEVVQAATDAENITFLASDIDADGGKIILAAGVPASQHDDEGRMLRAARQILDSDLDLSVRMGLNRGHVFVGDVGSHFRRTFTVMGDTVNLAARLMAAAGPGALYSSPAVLDEASTLFHTEALEPFHVKGKEEPVRAYQVHEEIGVRPPDFIHDLPFHGRDAEVEMLVSIVTTCARLGRGGMMTISGETGIGKSRLIAELLERCPGLATLMIKAEPNGSSNPYWAFRDPMRRKLGIQRADANQMMRSLQKVIKSTAPDLLSLIPLLGDVLHIGIPDNESTGAIDPRFRPDRTADAIIDLLSTIHDEPFAVIAEDGQWLDAASASLLRKLGVAAQQRPWTVIVTARSGDEEYEVFGEEILLTPLDELIIKKIANEVTAAAPLRPHELERIVTRAAGNPLFLSEILNVIRETGNADNIPDTLDAVVSTEIDTLAPLVRQTLRYSSVLGMSFPRVVLEEFLAPEEIVLDESIERELAKFIAGDDDSRLRFRHAVVHDVAYEGLSYRRRRDLHGRAGTVVERMSGNDPESSAEFLAHHFHEAGAYEKAWKYSRMAADKSRAAYANVEASAHYQRAIEAGRHLESAEAEEIAKIWIQLGDVYELTGQMEAAREALSRALRTSPGGPLHPSDVYLKRAGTWVSSGNLTQARRNVTLGKRSLEGRRAEDDLRRLAQLDAFEASIHMARGDPSKARRLAESSISKARVTGEEEALARAYGVLDWANFMMGIHETRRGPDAIDIYERLGFVERSVNLINNLGAFAYLEGNWDEAVDWYEKSLDAAERSGNVIDAALARANIAEVLIGQGKYDDAVPLLEEARRVYEASNAQLFMPLVRLLQGRAQMGLGRLEEALAGLATLLTEQENGQDTPWTGETALTLAEALIKDDQIDRASELIDDIELKRLGSPGTNARLGALAADATGDRERAMELIREAVNLAAEGGGLFEEFLALDSLAAITGRAGVSPDPTDARRLDSLRQTLGILPPQVG